MRILHLEIELYTEEDQKSLSKLGELVTLSPENQSDLIAFIKKYGDFDVIFTKLGLFIDKEIIDIVPSLKYVVTPTTGLNHIDCGYAEARGVSVISLRGESVFLAEVQSTAEHTWLLILSLLRNHVASVNSVVERGDWDRSEFLCEEINGKTVGIIGFGRLGKILFKYAKAFSAKVLVNDINLHALDLQDAVVNTPLEQVLENSDLVVLMINYLPANNKFFDQQKFNLMKKGSYFINTSRGELVDESALLWALESGKLNGAALDVLDGDSTWAKKFEGNEKLLHYARMHTNLIFTPHIGGYGKTSISKTRSFMVSKFLKVIRFTE